MPHDVQTYGRSLTCLRTCTRNTPEQATNYGIILVGDVIVDSLLLVVNPALQIVQTCGLNPVCVRVWYMSWPLCRKPFPQVEHKKGLSPVCLLT